MNKEESIKELSEALRDKSLSKQEYIRVQAVLLRKRGIKREEIAGIVGRSFDSVEDWIMIYNKKGISGLRTKTNSSKNASKLTEEQRENIKNILSTQTPRESLGLKQDFWDIPTLRKLVKKKFNIEYKSISSYTRLFSYCGYSYQRIEFRDIRRDSKSADKFKEKFRGKLKKGGTIVMSW